MGRRIVQWFSDMLKEAEANRVKDTILVVIKEKLGKTSDVLNT